ncbi:ADP-heptose--LPS-heptosyltransferase II [Escherichia coli]|uniref:lipopolysaccharide heptosyltransferase II n=1 Tax=Escherichia coli TaxID=562 RepID=A0A377AKQ4_ECOLX|nr:ADP-heptose--LPS-heptosyltransferase II [Escherichia coli]
MIGFCPGAEFGPAKRWPHYHYAELAKQLIDEGYQVVLFGSAKDHEAGNEILAALNTEQQAWCRNLAGETQLDQAVILIAACKAIVTNDSGLMHVAGGAQSSRWLPCMVRVARTSHRRYPIKRA